LDVQAISHNEFFSFYQTHISKEIKKEGSKGGDFYNTAPYRISKRFFELIYNSAKQNKILYMDAFHLTGLKPKTFDEYARKHLS